MQGAASITITRRRRWAGRLRAGLSAALVVAALAVPDDAAAQRRQRPRGRFVAMRSVPEAGIRAGRCFALDAWSLGGQLRLPLGARLELYPSADYFLVDDQDAWQANADAALGLGPFRTLYLGAGVAVSHRRFGLPSETTETGVNLFVGLEPARGRPGARLRPFLEARWTLVEDESPFHLAFGVNLALRSPTRRRALPGTVPAR